MKSRLFAKKPVAKGYRSHSAVGPSSGNGKADPDGASYTEGLAGGRAGRVAGGKSMSAHVNSPKNNAEMQGDGGWAWDSTMPDTMREPG